MMRILLSRGCLPNPRKNGGGGGGGDMNLPDWRFSKRGSLEGDSSKRGSPERGSPERGSLMLELVLGVIIVAGLTLFTGQILARYHETKREEASALYLEKLAEAAASYAGSAAFQSAINLGHLGSDDPSLTAFPAVDIATLKTEGYLPPSFPATDAYGGTPRILYQEGVVQKAGEGEDKNYVLNSVALLDHPAAMSRPRGMRILSRVLPFAAKGAGLGYFSAGVFHRVNGMTIEGAEAASLRGTTTAPTSLALMRSSPMKGRASGTPLDITVPPLDVSAYAAALGTEIEKMAKKYEDRIKEKLRGFDWDEINAREQMELGNQRTPNGVPEWDVPPHACPEGFAPQTALYDKGGTNFLRPSPNDMADERVSESAGIHHKARVRIGSSTQTITASQRTGWLPRTIPPHNRKNRNVLFLDSSTSQPVSGMHRSDGTEGDNLVFSTNLDANPATGYVYRNEFINRFHHHRGGHDHTHTIPSIRGKQVSATQDSINRASKCLRDKSGNNIKISLWMRGATYTSYAESAIEGRHRHEWYPTAAQSSPQYTECTYVRRNEVTPIRKCNFDRNAYYKKYPMRVRLVPPEDQQD